MFIKIMEHTTAHITFTNDEKMKKRLQMHLKSKKIKMMVVGLNVY